MPQVITDEKLIDEILERGVEQIFPDKKTLKEKLMSGERIRLYCGYDPTAPSLHIGNAVTINKLSQFQKLGHEVIFLVGDFTGMIGDPTDKTATRKKMTRKEVLKNAEDYKKQASGYLKFDGENPAKIMYNSEWSDKLSFKDLIELASKFTLQQMIDREMFKRNLAVVKCRYCGFEWKSPIQFGTIENFKSSTLIGNKTNCPNCGKMTGMDKEDIVMKELDRLRETPIAFHELLYPLAQGYDSVAMNVDLEIGGNDQMFNMLAGRTLQKNINNKEKFVMTLKLLSDETGKKMGKSEGNAVFLDQSPEDMYGAVMSWTDGTIAIGFEMATNIPMEEIEKIKEALKDEKNNPRDFKMKLAYEMVKINHGEEAAQFAQENFIKIVQKKEVPDEVKEEKAKNGEKLVDFIVRAKLAESNADAKRKIEQGGVSIDGEIIKDIQTVISEEMNGKILKVGKREFRKIIIG
ncbi:MAG TPA: tyrosine--tRNA ligase [Candidatus Moranbacteria bacterium]|nr:tyrosine--tRNA ligase [Candidatus Moranbacteria bacterium]